MSKVIAPHERGNQILNLLAEYGPLTTPVLREMLVPPMKPRRLRDALERLCKSKLIVRRFSGRLGSGYQINQRKPHKARAAVLLDKPELAHQYEYRFLLPEESAETSLIQYNLKKRLSGVEFLRDFQISSHPLARKLVNISDTERYLRPDILLLGNSSEDGRTISVAIEVDKHYENDNRLMNRITHLAYSSSVDAILYMVDEDTMVERLEDIERREVLRKIIELPLLHDFFFMVSDGNFNSKGNMRLMTLDGDGVAIKDWLSILANIDLRAEMNRQFRH